MLGTGLAQTAPGVAVALVTDMSTGLIDRFSPAPVASHASIFADQFHNPEVIVVDSGFAVAWWRSGATDPPPSPDPPRFWGEWGQWGPRDKMSRGRELPPAAMGSRSSAGGAGRCDTSDQWMSSRPNSPGGRHW